MSILSDLKQLGFLSSDEEKLFETKEDLQKRKEEAKASTISRIQEKELIYDKTFTCPVCGQNFTSKVMKSGKTRLLSTDLDLRPKYEGIDSNKYDVIQCSNCHYSVLTKFMAPVPSVIAKLLREQIGEKVKVATYEGETYSFEQVLERYKLALACAIVKKAKNSEKAYICMKIAWTYRGRREKLEEDRQLLPITRNELLQHEAEYLASALDGFLLAEDMEKAPICGMDAVTLQYLIATIAYEVGKLDIAAQKVGDILVRQGVNVRIKDKARDLKDMIQEKKKGK